MSPGLPLACFCALSSPSSLQLLRPSMQITGSRTSRGTEPSLFSPAHLCRPAAEAWVEWLSCCLTKTIKFSREQTGLGFHEGVNRCLLCLKALAHSRHCTTAHRNAPPLPPAPLPLCLCCFRCMLLVSSTCRNESSCADGSLRSVRSFEFCSASSRGSCRPGLIIRNLRCVVIRAQAHTSARWPERNQPESF